MNGKIKLVKSFENYDLSEFTMAINDFSEQHQNDYLEVQYQVVHRGNATWHYALVIVREN